MSSPRHGVSRALRLLAALVLLLAGVRAQAQDFEFHAPPAADDASTPAAMSDLADRMLPGYQDPDTDRYLATLSVLQMVAGNYLAANETRQSLQDRRKAADPNRPVGRSILFDLYAHARAIETGDAVAFPQAFNESVHEVLPRLSDHDAFEVTTWLKAPLYPYQDALQKAFDGLRGQDSVTLEQAIELMRVYLSYDAFRNFQPLAAAINAEDESARYDVGDAALIPTTNGAEIAVQLVRPKNLAKPLPALLDFSLYPSLDGAKASAAHGYVGVIAYTRGKRPPALAVVAEPAAKKPRKPLEIEPFSHDGDDAAAVIAWIAQQPWSDGRVGMTGTGYGGFAAWAAAARQPPALKAIATIDAMAPGIDFPARGRIFRNASYRWAVTNTQPATAYDDARWRALDQDWYRSGKPYRDLEKIAGLPLPLFRSWLNHPSDDRYWQKMMPTPQQFAGIAIPVLGISGYYSGSAGTSYYFSEHRRARPDADQTLLLGPYDGSTMRDRPSSTIRGFAVDAAAVIDLRELRYQWFDHVFKSADKPALLSDHLNYQLSGGSQWRHAPAPEAVTDGSLRFYPDDTSTPDRPRLTQMPPAAAVMMPLTVDLADRSDAATPASIDIQSKTLIPRNGLRFTSEPVQQVVEISGFLSGQLDFWINKRDADLVIGLYEQRPDGDVVQLCDPFEFRASYARDRATRHLFKPDRRQTLAFTSDQFASRQLQPGSRIVITLSVSKSADREINYGAGQDVSAASIADAGKPLELRWYGSSYFDVPMHR